MKHIKLLFIGLIIGLLFSCEVTPIAPKPHNSVLEKGHDQWDKVEFTFYEGHTHGLSFHATPKLPDSIKYFRQPQTITFKQGTSGLEISGSTTIRLIGGLYYAIVINYYNRNGELMNHEFVDGGMDKIHQHFFRVEDLTPTRDDAKVDAISALPSSGEVWDYNLLDYVPAPPLVQGKTNPYLFYYVYQDKADTKKGTPLKQRTWDKTNPESYDPIGLKGYFYISRETYFQKFNLRVFLAHFTKPNKLKTSTEPYSFNEIPKGAATDLSLTIPIWIFTSGKFESEDQEEMNKFYLQEAAKAFNISEEEAKKDYDRQSEAIIKVDPESSPIWL